MGAPVRHPKLDEIPVFPEHDSPPPLGATDVDHRPSPLGLLLDHLERGIAREDQFLLLCLRPESLEGISPREAQRAIERFALMHAPFDAARARAMLNVLMSLSERDRATCAALLDPSVRRALLEADADTPLACREVARILGALGSREVGTRK